MVQNIQQQELALLNESKSVDAQEQLQSLEEEFDEEAENVGLNNQLKQQIELGESMEVDFRKEYKERVEKKLDQYLADGVDNIKRRHLVDVLEVEEADSMAEQELTISDLTSTRESNQSSQQLSSRQSSRQGS